MVQAYNFLASWQLFPEKSNYENGVVPKSGIYRLEATDTAKTLRIFHNRVLPDNTSLAAEYQVLADGEKNTPPDTALGDFVEVFIPDGLNLDIRFYRGEQMHLQVQDTERTEAPTPIRRSITNNSVYSPILLQSPAR